MNGGGAQLCKKVRRWVCVRAGRSCACGRLDGSWLLCSAQRMMQSRGRTRWAGASGGRAVGFGAVLWLERL